MKKHTWFCLTVVTRVDESCSPFFWCKRRHIGPEGAEGRWSTRSHTNEIRLRIFRSKSDSGTNYTKSSFSELLSLTFEDFVEKKTCYFQLRMKRVALFGREFVLYRHAEARGKRRVVLVWSLYWREKLALTSTWWRFCINFYILPLLWIVLFVLSISSFLKL